jgi:hypothetical protein
VVRYAEVTRLIAAARMSGLDVVYRLKPFVATAGDRPQ